MPAPRTSYVAAPCARGVLLLQHNQLVNRSLARYLSAFFPHVYTATNETDACDLLSRVESSPDALVCGLHFGPRRGVGPDIARRLKALHPNLKQLVLLTSDPDWSCDERDIDAVIGKPFDAQQLIRTLGAAAIAVPSKASA